MASKNTFDYYKDTFDVIDTILAQHSNRELVNHQHASYKQFIEKDIGDVIRQFNTRKLYFSYNSNANKHKLELHIDFLNYNLGRPTIYENDGSFKVMRPDIAKLRNLTYSSPITMNVKLTRILRTSSNPEVKLGVDGREEVLETYDQEDVKEEIFNNINFGRIPIMVMGANCVLVKKDGTTLEQNGECSYDTGGYFIIGGNEKVIISQERIAENEPFVFNNQKKNKCKEIEIRCSNDQCFSVVIANVVRLLYRDNILEFENPSLKNPIPLLVLLKALGVSTDKKLFEYIAWDMDDEFGKFITEILKSSFERFKKICRTHCINTDADPAKFQEIIINYLKFKNPNKEVRLSHDDKMACVRKLLDDDILPHLGKDYSKKAKFLGYMTRKLILVQNGHMPYDDRDAYENKRVDAPGRLLSIQFRQCFNKLVKDMVKSITREIKNNKSKRDVFEIITNNNIYKIIKPTIIDGGLKYALATGNWGIKTGGKGNIKAGTAQVLNRLSHQSFISHLRRVNSPSDKTGSNGKIVKPRKLHGSSWGYLCPAETPEGQPVGLVKNLSLTAKITTNSNSHVVRAVIMALGIKPINDCEIGCDIACNVLVFVNGDWLGITNEPKTFVSALRRERRQGNINIFTGIHWNIEQRTIKVYTDIGRITRPMYIVDGDNRLRITPEYMATLKETGYAFNFLISPKFYEQSKAIPNIEYANHISSIGKITELFGIEGVIEYVDSSEVNNCYFAMTIEDLDKAHEPYNNTFTHCEIFPGLILGAVAGVIPFPDDNQSPRNCYQCLSPEETVLMADGSWKSIGNIKIGDKVITFNPKNMELSNTKVIRQFTIPLLAPNKTYRIETISGRSIIATADHCFMTTDGWMEVGHMNATTKIGICLSSNPYSTKEELSELIMNEYIRINAYKSKYSSQTTSPDGSRSASRPTSRPTSPLPATSIELQATMVYIPLARIEEVDCPFVSDITVESKNHSFIAGSCGGGGFLSSNCAMGKQSIGLYASNYQKRMDTLAYVLNNLERALVKTRFAKYINYDELPCGVNAIVAIGSYTGYNMEDSVILNKSAVDRGLFRATFYRTYKDDEKKIQSSGREEKFAKPNPKYTRGTKPGNYDKLDERGFIRKDEYVTSEDIIIGKVLPLKNKLDENGHQLYKDCSTSLRSNETGFVDKIYNDRNADGFRFVKIRMRTERVPIIGDKFASRCAQKGTVGMIYPQETMPFNANGISPDIIMNPHAIPSRMTIGMLVEMILGKAAASLCGYADCTPFNKISYDAICEILEANGFNYTGDEILYSGISGQQMDVKFFMGPTYYQRLKHMVLDKQHSRASGPVVQLTRQPAEGRSRDGGLRFGEMEKDCLSGKTAISGAFGLSLKIQDLEKIDLNVLGWNQEKNGMKPAKKTNFMYKGERECVDIWLEDGRKITCTPEHKILASNNEWIKANELKIGEARVKCSVNYPTIGIYDEMQQCNNWSLKVSETLTLKTDTPDDFIKSMAFCRLLGYLLTDGYISDKYVGAYIYLGHKIDVERLVDDINLFTPITQTDFKDKHRNIYIVKVPHSLIDSICNLDGLMTGSKVKQCSKFPTFLLQPTCPLPLIREFLGGLFGGDGHTCVISKNTFTYIGFSKSKVKPHLDSLKAMMEQIKTWLALFDIKCVSIQAPRVNTASKTRENDDERNYEIVLHLDMHELIPFHDKIGFRYCCHKNQRMEAAVAYTSLRKGVIRQKKWIITRVDELTNYSKIKSETPNKIVHTSEAIIKAVAELKEQEPLLHSFVIPNNHDITEYLINGREGGHIPSSKFPTSTQFLESIDAKDWFSESKAKKYQSKKNPNATSNAGEEDDIEDDIEDNIEESIANETNAETAIADCNRNHGVCHDGEVLPTMNLKVIDIRPGGTHPVYDIQVDKEESFLANGVVAHNCMIAHGAMGFLKERMMDVSDKFTVYICNECGLFSSVNPDDDAERKCGACDNYSEFTELNIPYACKLLMQELEGMMITPRFNQEKP